MALALDLAEHIPYWGWRYAIEIAPMQLLFVLMYLWRKDIMACIIGHFLTDALPFMIPLAMAGAVSLSGYGNMHEMLASARLRARRQCRCDCRVHACAQIEAQRPAVVGIRAGLETMNRDYVAAISDYNDVSLRIRRSPILTL